MAQTRIREDIRVLIYACTAYYRQGRHVIQLPTRPAVSPLRLVLVIELFWRWTRFWVALPGQTSDRFFKYCIFRQVFPRSVDFERQQKNMVCEDVDGWYVVGLTSCGMYWPSIQWCPRTSTTWSQRTDVTSGSPSTMTRPSSTAYTSKPR